MLMGGFLLYGGEMRTRLRLNPGQKGTKRPSALYGDRLVCVRYRYDEVRKKRFKTVELIIDEVEWTPPQPKFPPDALVPVRVAADDLDLRRKVKEAGGRWNPEEKVWYVPYGAISGSRIEKHIVVDAGER